MCDSCVTPPPSDSTSQARDLHRRIRRLVTIERRSMHDLALGLARMHAGRLYRQLGYAGLVEYGEQAFGFSPTKSRQLALLGRKLPELPALDRAMVDGALGWTKARTLIQIATPDTVEAWLERALQVSNRELEELVARAMPGGAPPDPADDWQPPRHVWAKLRLDPLHFERLMRAVAQIRHELGDADMSHSQCLLTMADRTVEADAVLEDSDGGSTEQTTHVCRDSQTGENAAAVTTRIIAHRCPSCERAWMESAAGRLELDARDRALVGCDAEVVVGDSSAVATRGHVGRTIPPATRRAVLIRDGGRCQVPGCRCKRHLELHHVQPRSAGGSNHERNLVTVCWTHHDMVHKDVLRVSPGPDGALRWDRGPGEPLGLRVSIHGEGAELEQADLADFEGPAGSWFAIQGYFGAIEPLDVDVPCVGTAHVCPDEPSSTPPAPFPRRYPRGRQMVRIGDDQRMAPAWMARNLGG